MTEHTTQDTTASGATELPEFPGHPEPQVMRWSALESEAIRKYGSDMFRAGRLAACAPKAEPAINKVSDIIDAYGIPPGQPERVADIPGLAEALEAAFADGSAQVTGAAQAAPDIVEELIRERDHRDEIIDALCDAVLEDRPEWSSSYYFEDAVVAVQERIAELEAHKECRDLNAQAAPAPVAEDAEDAARYRWLKLQARPNEPFELFDKLREAHALVKAFDVFCTRWGGWDASIDAARAQAAQPEGGA